MLSAETAAGKYPVEAVAMMDSIARQTEGHLWKQSAFRSLARKPRGERPFPLEDALSESMAKLSRDLMVRAITVNNLQGRSLKVMAAARPAAPIVGICRDYQAACVAGLLWGVIPLATDLGVVEDPHDRARRTVRELGLAAKGDTILVVSGFSTDPAENVPSVTIVTV
jgi:pyruvate kinase